MIFVISDLSELGNLKYAALYSDQKQSKHFLMKFFKVTSDLFEIKIKWITKKTSSLFFLRSKHLHPAWTRARVCLFPFLAVIAKNLELTTVQKSVN